MIHSPGEKKPYTMCICAYGDFPHLIGRCLDAMVHEPQFFQYVDLIIGGNMLSDASYREIQHRIPKDVAITVVRSHENLNKSGMRRIMLSHVETPYTISCDDDIILKPGWLRKLHNHLMKHAPYLDASGFTLITTHAAPKTDKFRNMPYELYPVRKKWWRARKEEKDGVIKFPGGGFHIMRTEFVRQNDFPDFSMLIDFDDILLGDLVTQAGGYYVSFPTDLYEKIIIDLTPSRGDHWKG